MTIRRCHQQRHHRHGHQHVDHHLRDPWNHHVHPRRGSKSTYANGATATWTIGNATFTGSTILGDLANFNGLGITAGAGSKAHFSALATLTGNYTGGEDPGVWCHRLECRFLDIWNQDPFRQRFPAP